MKNKKGFTLVELLAVIVILGVLLLIAVPGVQSIIKSSKKKSFLSVAKLAAENVETLVSANSYTGTCYLDMEDTEAGIKLERGTYGKAYGFVLVESGKVMVYVNNTETKTKIVGKTLSEMSNAGFDFGTGDGNLNTIPKVRATVGSYFYSDGTPIQILTSAGTEVTKADYDAATNQSLYTPKISKCSF